MMQNRGLTELIRKHQWAVGIVAVLTTAGFFRFWELSALAPGLGQAEAELAMRSLAFGQHPRFDLFGEGQSFGTSVFTALQSIFISLFGSTVLGVRLLPAMLGVASVLLVYLWASNWFNRRIGLIAALLYAVTPWIVTASRRGDSYSWLLFTIPLALWAFTRALQTGSAWRYLLAGIALGLGLNDDPSSALLVVSTMLMTTYLTWRRRDFIKHAGKGVWLALAGLFMVLGLTLLGHANNIGLGLQAILPDLAIAQQSISRWLTAAIKTLLMFNYRGDLNFSNNVAGLPLFNFFVGLMLAMGILVSASRYHRARYSGLLLMTMVLLAPAVLSPYAPDARAALAAAPLLVVLASIGISYLLDIWYGTFPVNSAARTLGTLPVLLLLLITVYQGYKQYFVAWAGSPEVYQVYNEPAMAIAGWMNRTSYEGQRFVAVDDYSRNVLDYLTHSRSKYSAISYSDVAQVPADGQPKQVVLVTAAANDAIKTLKERFPKARLSQHYSQHNDNNELFMVFEVLK